MLNASKINNYLMALANRVRSSIIEMIVSWGLADILRCIAWIIQTFGTRLVNIKKIVSICDVTHEADIAIQLREVKSRDPVQD